MFNLEHLELRRIRYDIVLMFKIISIFADVNHDKILKFSKSTNTIKYISRKLGYPSANNPNIHNVRKIPTFRHIKI